MMSLPVFSRNKTTIFSKKSHTNTTSSTATEAAIKPK